MNEIIDFDYKKQPVGFDPFGLHHLGDQITLTPDGLSFVIPKKRKYEKILKEDLIRQLDYNSGIALSHYENSDVYNEYNLLFNKLVIEKVIKYESFIKFEKSIYELKILYINLNDRERSIVKSNYNRLINNYANYYKFFYIFI